MKKQQLVTDVIRQIESVLAKSSGLLSNAEVKILEDAIASLKSLKQSTPKVMRSRVVMVLELLLRVLLSAEGMEQIHHLLDKL